MRSIEEVEQDMGLPRYSDRPRYTSCCTYNPSEDDDPRLDCAQPSRWHLRLKANNEVGSASVQACDRHLSKILGTRYAEAMLDRHEMGSACGLEDSWWIDRQDDTTSFCVTVERGVELGYLKYE